MYTAFMVVQVLTAFALVGLILIQHGKGADAGAAFGAGASGTVFGSRGSANFLSRTTAILAAVFFIVSLALAYLVTGQVRESDSVAERAAAAAGIEQAPQAATLIPGEAGDAAVSVVPEEQAAEEAATEAVIPE